MAWRLFIVLGSDERRSVIVTKTVTKTVTKNWVDGLPLIPYSIRLSVYSTEGPERCTDADSRHLDRSNRGIAGSHDKSWAIFSYVTALHNASTKKCLLPLTPHTHQR
jgi:hypothetical protein